MVVSGIAFGPLVRSRVRASSAVNSFESLPADGGAEHLMLASENFARASANTLPANRPKARAHWLSYVRVDDMDASTARLVALGGRVLVEPRVDRHGGRVAVVADPLGAPFGLLEWKAGDSKEVGE